jgi:hypothetical protein
MSNRRWATPRILENPCARTTWPVNSFYVYANSEDSESSSCAADSVLANLGLSTWLKRPLATKQILQITATSFFVSSLPALWHVSHENSQCACGWDLPLANLLTSRHLNSQTPLICMTLLSTIPHAMQGKEGHGANQLAGGHRQADW